MRTQPAPPVPNCSICRGGGEDAHGQRCVCTYNKDRAAIAQRLSALDAAGAALVRALDRYGFPVSDAASTANMSIEARDLHNAARRFQVALRSTGEARNEPAVTNGGPPMTPSNNHPLATEDGGQTRPASDGEGSVGAAGAMPTDPKSPSPTTAEREGRETVKHTIAPPEGMVEVTKEQFFATVGRLNVHPLSQMHGTYWETPLRERIGYSLPGYMCVGPNAWFVRAAIASALGQAGGA